MIDFGTAEVFHIPGKNTDLYNSYCKIREKFAPTEARESINGHAPHYDGPEIHTPDKLTRKTDYNEEVFKPKNRQSVNYIEEYKDNLKHRKSFVGTVYYVAPEMLEDQEVDPGCDLWALGIIIHKMLTGEYLFNEPNDYLTFEAIRKGQYKLHDDIPEEAKDLISRLLVKNPKLRLGNGPEGSDIDFKALKRHPFFKDLDWSLLQTCASPLKLENSAHVEEDRDSDLQENLLHLHIERKNDKKIVLTGLVKKMKYVFMYNTRQLILHSDGTLEYFDPKENVMKGKVILNKSTQCFAKADNVFHVSLTEREYVFNTVDVPAKMWIEKIKQVIHSL